MKPCYGCGFRVTCLINRNKSTLPAWLRREMLQGYCPFRKAEILSEKA